MPPAGGSGWGISAVSGGGIKQPTIECNSHIEVSVLMLRVDREPRISGEDWSNQRQSPSVHRCDALLGIAATGLALVAGYHPMVIALER